MWKSFWKREREEKQIRMRIFLPEQWAFAERDRSVAFRWLRVGERAQKQVTRMTSVSAVAIAGRRVLV